MLCIRLALAQGADHRLTRGSVAKKRRDNGDKSRTSLADSS